MLFEASLMICGLGNKGQDEVDIDPGGERNFRGGRLADIGNARFRHRCKGDSQEIMNPRQEGEETVFKCPCPGCGFEISFPTGSVSTVGDLVKYFEASGKTVRNVLATIEKT